MKELNAALLAVQKALQPVAKSGQNAHLSIEIKPGHTMLFDEEDRELVESKRWILLSRPDWNTCYAIAMIKNEQGRRSSIRFNRVIMGSPKGFDVDHINRNGLDNRRCNLRICTHAENNRNSGKPKCNTSGYKGVSWYKQYSKWMVRVKKDYKNVFIGYFDDVVEAAKAYDEAAKLHFGVYALLNFPESE